jgi:hypothetical protein
LKTLLLVTLPPTVPAAGAAFKVQPARINPGVGTLLLVTVQKPCALKTPSVMSNSI